MIRLAILCRDEAERLPALAERVGALVHDAVILLDDRTEDATVEVAERLFAPPEGLPGGLLVEEFTFVDFAQARNRLLDVAREDLRADDYLLLLDPDSLPDGDLPAELTAPAYSCLWRWGGEEWPRVILLRADTHARYDGAVHEVLSIGGELLPGVTVEAVVTASRERVEWIASMLARDAATNPRSAFYLAQSYVDLDRRDEALGWYLRRAAMSHGWREETYLATYLAGCIAEPLDWEWAEKLWRRAAAISPSRGEPWYQLARAANRRGDHSEALSLAGLGLRVGRSTDTLRVNRWIEQQGLSDEFNAAALAMLGPTLQPAQLA